MVTEVWSIINGTRINHTQGSGNQWVGTGTAPLKSSYSQPNHVYQVTTYAKDDAGNTDSYESTLRVVEKVAPTITPTSPTTGSTITNNKPAITWEVKDDDSGVNTASIGITIDSGSEITGDGIQKQAIAGGYKCTYTPPKRFLTAITRSSLMRRIMTGMWRRRRASQSKWIPYRLL